MHCGQVARQNLANEFPIHVVKAWLGNTPLIAMKHCLLMTDDDFERTANGRNESGDHSKSTSEKVTHQAVRKGSETARYASKQEGGRPRNSKGNGRLRVNATCRSGDDRIRTCGTV